MKKSDKIIGIVLCIIGVCTIAAYLIFSSAATEVKAVSVYPKSVKRIITCTGTVTAKNSETVTYDETVYPDTFSVSVGDTVEDGDLLMTALNSRLRKVKIYSDYSGVVTSLPVSVGKETKAGAALAVISQTDELQIKTHISESDASAISVGANAEIKGNGFNGRTYSGTVSRVSGVAEQSSSNGTVVGVTVDIQNADASILLGMSAKIYITAQNAENAIAVPYSAIEYDGDDTYVYIMRGKKAEKVKVEVGVEGEKEAEITSGLKTDDKVIEDKSKLLSCKNIKVVADD